jgi:hypothetical protein
MSAKRHQIESQEIQGLKLFKGLSKMLEGLHEAGCARDRAGNRVLHMDQYMLLLLLYMFNPICVSLRSLQQASELRNVQKALGVPRTSLGSLSEATGVFDSELLIEIIGDLVGQLKPIPHDARLDELGAILTAVDGTILPALPKMVWALWKDEEHRGVKAHVQFEILKGVPVAAVITEGIGNEKTILAANLQPGRFYVIDRGYAMYKLFQDMITAGSSFVGRLRDNAVYRILRENALTAADVEAGVIRDRVVQLGSEGKSEDLKQPVRIVEVKCEPHRKRSHAGRGGPEQSETLLLVTDRLDLPAEVIGLIFRHRWTVEIFFRFFKHVLGCRHLLSTKQEGVKLQTYAAIIACLLIALWTGRKPTLRTYEMICYYLMGWAQEDELLAHIAKLQKQE